MSLKNDKKELDRYYLRFATTSSYSSVDPSTRVGALLVKNNKPFNDIQIYGFNRFPKLINTTNERLHDRELKYKLTVHAERSALLLAGRIGISCENSTMYIVKSKPDRTHSFGGPPCVHCLIEILEAGVKRIVTYEDGDIPKRWLEDHILSKELIKESGIDYTVYDRNAF